MRRPRRLVAADAKREPAGRPGRHHFSTEVDPQLTTLIKATGFDGAIAAYTFVHTQLANDPDTRAVRIRLQDRLVAVAADLAARGEIARQDVIDTIRTGIQAARALAFGVLAAQPQWADADLLVQGISGSQSGNEQYHALLAPEAAWPMLDTDGRRRIHDAIRSNKWIPGDDDRQKVAARILASPVA